MKFNPFTNKFLFFGHRGAPHFAPENTLISFKNAIDMGVDGIELDVISTLDEKIIIHHDTDLVKLTGEPTKLSSMGYDEIKKIDVSRKWNSEFGFQKIPLLSEIVELLDSNNIILNIEIKSTGFFPTIIVEKVYDFITQHKLEKRCIVSSFNPLIIRKMNAISPKVFTALIWSKDVTQILLRWYKPLFYIAKPNGFHPDKLFTDKKLVKWAKSKKLPICVFTVNTKAELDRLIKLGVNGVFTDNPEIKI